MPLSKHIIRVPVKLVDDHWEVLYGGLVKVKDGAIGELHIDRIHFTNEQFLRALTEKRRIQALQPGTELRVALTIQSPMEKDQNKWLLERQTTIGNDFSNTNANTRFVRVYLRGPTPAQKLLKIETGGLWLCLEGMEPRGIESGMVELPDTNGLEAVESLNQAFTRLSEVFEPWRKAHTGSVYERVFYEEDNGRWYPLKDLRDRELVDAERKVISKLWANVATELGISWT